mmetsp:Transcript_90473/g.292361  ORF Transcript_90473/g.292361 Transcript_90473/m.292361 type:complete len:86 (-) Transcript_90473:82-339(-)
MRSKSQEHRDSAMVHALVHGPDANSPQPLHDRMCAAAPCARDQRHLEKAAVGRKRWLPVGTARVTGHFAYTQHPSNREQTKGSGA